jgi:broad specificity phosphatase PhoE/predicted kinase
MENGDTTPFDGCLDRLIPCSASGSSPPDNSKLRLFIKFGAVVKRVELDLKQISTVQQLHAMVLSKFEIAPDSKEALLPLYIQDKNSQIWYQLEDMKEIYKHAVIELRGSTHDPQHDSRSRRIEYSSFVRNEKLVFVMVGLPARGKTFLARKLARYLNWLGVTTRVFNVGSYRREKLGAHQPPDFFDPNNVEGSTARLQMAVLALDDMFEWLNKGGMVGIYDATNSTRERRQLILSRIHDEPVQVIFIESICEDPDIINTNLRETKLHSPDFTNVNPEEALQQFIARIEYYKRAYETIAEDEGVSYIKLFDVGKKIIINNLPDSYLPGRVVFFLMNLHIVPRPIFLTRHGQSEDNLNDRIGGDSKLTPQGEQYAQVLSAWIAERFSAKSKSKEKKEAGAAPNQAEGGEKATPPTAADDKIKKVASTGAVGEASVADKGRRGGSNLAVWTSTLARAIATSQYLPQRKVQLRCLDEIDAGKCDGMTYEQIAKEMPQEFAARAADKLRYRYPQGESYEDVIQRLEPIIFEMERQRNPILVIAHNAVIRCLYAYFKDKTPEECPNIDIPLHTLIELTPKAYGCEEQRYPLLKDKARL